MFEQLPMERMGSGILQRRGGVQSGSGGVSRWSAVRTVWDRAAEPVMRCPMRVERLDEPRVHRGRRLFSWCSGHGVGFGLWAVWSAATGAHL